MNKIKASEIKVMTKGSTDIGKGEGQLKFRKVIRTDRNFLCCKYSNDRSVIAAGTTLGTLELFNTKNGSHMVTLVDSDISESNKASPLTEITNKLKNADGTMLCCYTTGMIKNWHTKTFQCNYTIREDRQILGIKYHPHLPRFVTFGEDGVIYMYDEETYKVIQKFAPSNGGYMDGHNNRVFSASFHPRQENEFISGGWDSTVQFWDMRHEHAVRHISDVYMCGDGLDINRNGNQILACAWMNRDSIRIYDYRTAQMLKILTPDVHTSQLYCGKFLGFNYFITGGTNANLVRTVDMRTLSSVALATNLPGAVYSIDMATKPDKTTAEKEDITNLPNCLFCSSKNLYEIRFIN